ncbi:C2 domain containing protein [Tritrichomonas foetus]|uniref:C2 domain containing protein n=1 Tax=Tritrichomonas foetus TaxID=1144522 RepID=A0A1J4KM90_9EUKA|nr:C2 domain containing protein [Tritrichomonas foetus]|eukprot:OHT12339.1 C2 domain containing protein [Tritrichomonas foetus]
MKSKKVLHHQLYIQVKEARTLLPADVNGWSDPFCIVSLGTKRFKKIHRTKYINRTLNPRWNESFNLPYDAEKDRYESILRFKVFDHDTMTANDELGFVEIPLAPLNDNKWVEQWYKLKNVDSKGNHLRCRGYIRIKLQIVEQGQMSFLDSDMSDQTNIHETRNDIFTKEQERIHRINKQHEIMNAQANDQLQQSIRFHNDVRTHAKHRHAQRAENPDIPEVENEPEINAPLNPQYDYIPPNQGMQPGIIPPANYNPNNQQYPNQQYGYPQQQPYPQQYQQYPGQTYPQQPYQEPNQANDQNFQKQDYQYPPPS